MDRRHRSEPHRSGTRRGAPSPRRSEATGRTNHPPPHTKIQALTLELAHLRRMRFGASSEALSAEQRDLFQETLASDLAAAQAELAKKQAEAAATTEPQAPRAARSRAGRRQPLPEHLPRIEHRHEPDSCTLRNVRPGSGQDRRGHERTARCGAGALLRASVTSARSTPAVAARRCRRRRSRPL